MDGETKPQRSYSMLCPWSPRTFQWDNPSFFFFFWLCWVSVAARRLSLAVVSGAYSSLWCAGFSFRWLLLLRSTGSRRTGFRSCSTQAQWLWFAGSRAQAQQLWCKGLVAPQHVGFSRARDRTHVPCISWWILNHCTTREVPVPHSLCEFSFDYPGNWSRKKCYMK